MVRPQPIGQVYACGARARSGILARFAEDGMGNASRIFFALGVVAALALAARAAEPPPPQGSGIRGKVLFEGKPAAGVWMHAYADAATDFRGKAAAAFGPTAADGRFLLPLDPGRYYLVGKRAAAPSAEAEPAVGDLFGYYGGSPVSVSAGAFAEVNLQLVMRRPLSVADGEGPVVTIEGTALGPRGPELGTAVFAFPDAKMDFRGPDLTGPQGSVIGGTGPDGRFSIELPPGTYYLTATKRTGGSVLGPLKTGDLYGWFDGNPLRLAAGQKATVVIQMAEKLRQTESPGAATRGVTGIRGSLRDPAGRPVAGVFAFATTDPNLIGAMPPYRSQPAAPDGSYFIELPRGGVYYVGARTGFGGPPLPGQWWGLYGGDKIRQVSVEGGAVADGIDVTVKTVE
jgi:hypothetical protein